MIYLHYHFTHSLISNSMNISETPSTKQETYKKHFGHCFEISKFEEGDMIPVGGKSIFSQEANIKVRADFSEFSDTLKETHELANSYNVDKLHEWLRSNSFEIDAKLFATLFAFTKKLAEKYPDNPARAETRRKLYHEAGDAITLHDVFSAHSAECAEIAALAQVYLQQAGVPSTYFSGDVLWKRDREQSSEHSFIVIRQEDVTYIYDPANPVNTTSGLFPSIATTKISFDTEVAKNKKVFVTATNLISKKEAFYGTNNGTNVWAEAHIAGD